MTLRVLQLEVPLAETEAVEQVRASVGQELRNDDGVLLLRVCAVDEVRAAGVAVVTATTELAAGYLSVEAPASAGGGTYDVVAF